VALQGEAEARIILDDMLPQRHFRQERHRAHFTEILLLRPRGRRRSG
jgi:hypothetical protein